MTTQTTNGITIAAETFYQQDHSNPIKHWYMFAYRITIQNLRTTKVQLMEREWTIFDAAQFKVGNDNPKAPLYDGKSEVIGCMLRKQLADIRCYSGAAKHYRVVGGEGVLGMLPVIEPYTDFQYVSGANLHSPIGSMRGFYTIHDLDTKEIFVVPIPKFDLIVPFLFN